MTAPGDAGERQGLKPGPRWRVPLPPGEDYRVFVNGVPQVEGRDYELRDGELLFDRELKKEGKLGLGRWTAMFFGLFGTYRQNDSVDVQYTVNGERRVAVGLDIIPPPVQSPTDAHRPDPR